MQNGAKIGHGIGEQTLLDRKEMGEKCETKRRVRRKGERDEKEENEK